MNRVAASILLTLLMPAIAAGEEADLLKPLPDRGAVPRIVDGTWPTASARGRDVLLKRYQVEMRRIARKHFGTKRVPAIREAGFDAIRKYDDPVAFLAMIDIFDREKDDVLVAVLDHLAASGDDGQAALAYTAIHHEHSGLRQAASDRLVAPVSRPVLQVLDEALRSRKHNIANNAGAIAGALHAVEVLPLLIFSQATRDRVEQKGDLAWIAIETQQPFVAGLAPVVGDNSGAFLPIIGVAHEGTVLRVMDAVVVVYRTEIHLSLVNMSSFETGTPTEEMGYDMRRWWAWYNDEYVPMVNERRRRS